MTTILEIWNERRRPFLCQCPAVTAAQDYVLVLGMLADGRFQVRYKLQGYDCIEAGQVEGGLIAIYVPTTTHALFKMWPMNPVVRQEVMEALRAPQR